MSPEAPGFLPVIPAQVGVADADSADVPPGQPAPAWAAPAWAVPAEAPSADSPAEGFSSPEAQGEPVAEQTVAEHAVVDELAVDEPAAEPPAARAADVEQPVPGQAAAGSGQSATGQAVAGQRAPEPGEGPAGPQAVPAPGGPGHDEPLRLFRIGAEGDDEPWTEDPWLPGSGRPDRRAPVIGVVVIAGLLAVASTAWLVGTNQPQAVGTHGSHQSRPSQLGSGQGQPSQALSGHPVPSLTPRSQPAPVQTGASPAQTAGSGHGQRGHGQSGHRQAGHGQTGHAQTGQGQSGSHPGTSPGGTGHSSTGPTSTPRPGTSQAAAQRTGTGKPGTSHTGNGQSSPGLPVSRPTGTTPASPAQPVSRPAGPSPASPGQPGSSQSRSGQSGPGRTRTGHGTTTPAPHPRHSAPASGKGGRPRRSAHGIVSVGPGLGARPEVRRAAALLDRYFAAVNHRDYQAYERLFAQRHLTPREFAWGYGTSHDTKAALAGVSPLRGGLKATVTFTSHQDPAGSPDHSSCIDWRITLFLHRAGATYLIGMPPTGYRADFHACRFAPRHGARGQSGHRSAGHAGSPKQAPRDPRRKNR
ncbi:MAG: hypothetical protein ACR2MP_09580 [Streptosporangiaceae bacterium]